MLLREAIHDVLSSNHDVSFFGWELIDYNDDCRGSLNSCIETALPAGQYLIGASTYEYMRTRRPTAASYDLQVTCNDAGACAPVAQVCGGRGNEACPEGTFCSFPQSAICGWADATGFCRPIPDVCAAIDQPVCGCDGRNYGNTCQAAQHGVSAQYDGVCGAGEGELCGGIAGILCRDGFRCDMSANEFCGADLAGTCVSDEPAPCTREYMPECGCNGVTYNNACERRQAGVPLDHDGACGRVAGEGELCGGIAGFVCERGLLCDMSANTFCGADLAGTCRVDEPRFCPAHYDPVCGCDGVTYSNACQLGVAGAAFDHDGPC